MNKQLSLFDGVSDQSCSLTDSVSERKRQAIERFLRSGSKNEPVACVNEYSPGKRKLRYYRLSYRIDNKVKHIHIPGGSTISELAQYRATKLQELIDRGAELAEVLAMVNMFKGRGK